MNHSASISNFQERIIPDETEKGIIAVHMKRYVFAEEACRNKDVLDVACGTGYGAFHLSGSAKSVIGVDCSEKAISYASRRYQRPNVSFCIMDACSLSFPDESFDAICSFETIEHLADVETYLGEMARVLRPGGVYLVSTPCAARTTQKPENPFHYQEWSPADFEQLLGRYFQSVKLFGQKRRQTALHRILQKTDIFKLRKRFRFSLLTKSISSAVGTTPFVEMGLEDLEIVEDDFKGADYIIGLCSDPKKNGT